MLSLVGCDKQVAEGEVQQRMSNTLSFGYVYSAKPLTWQEHCYTHDREQHPLVHRHFNTVRKNCGKCSASQSDAFRKLTAN